MQKTDVCIIQPTGSIDSALEQNGLSADCDTIRVLGFPKFLSKFDIELERKLFDNRDTTMSVTVDLLKGTCRRNDIYPEIETRSFLSTSLLNPRLKRETAVETAHSFVRRQVNRWYKSYTAPQITPANEATVFKLFWIVPVSSSSTVHVIDTISNQLIAEDVELDKFTQKPTNSSTIDQ